MNRKKIFKKHSMNTVSRRRFMAGAGILSVDLFINGCSTKKEVNEVSAIEDLMREHGILRRALFVYSEAAAKLRSDPSAFPADALQRTARLFRSFGEDYHEKKLEEAYIFPAVKKAGSEAGRYPDVLVAQHQRGREITDYILTATRETKLDADDLNSLSFALDSFVRMYRPHAAREDTVVFPAWKQTLKSEDLDEMNDKFEDIEHQQFGEDGFENAIREISGIEAELGLSDLALFTPSF
jgi:hemerythrin-like domain-containing protein